MTKPELELHLERTIEILQRAKQYNFDSYNLLIFESSEKFTVIRDNEFMVRIQEALWNLAIIETHKLFGGANDNFRIQKVISYLREGYRNSEWRNDITLNEINSLEEVLNTSNLHNKIESIKELRDQHYAHSHKIPKRHETEMKLYFEGLNEVLGIAELICTQVRRKLFNDQIFLIEIDFDSVKNTVEGMVEYIRMKGRESLGKDN